MGGHGSQEAKAVELERACRQSCRRSKVSLVCLLLKTSFVSGMLYTTATARLHNGKDWVSLLCYANSRNDQQTNPSETISGFPFVINSILVSRRKDWPACPLILRGASYHVDFSQKPIGTKSRSSAFPSVHYMIPYKSVKMPFDGSLSENSIYISLDSRPNLGEYVSVRIRKPLAALASD